MHETSIRISAREQMRMKAIALDDDRDDAVAMVKELLRRVEALQNSALRPHLDT